MDIKEFKSKLRAGEVRFTFKKKDGSRRPTVGTLSVALIPESVETKTDSDKDTKDAKPKRKLAEGQVFFYDLEKKGFRSFIFDNLVSVD